MTNRLYEYEATDVGFDGEDDALTISFGGLPDADGCPSIYLMLQRSTDENEDEQGIDGVYVEWCDQGMSCYGCITSFDLYPEKIRVTFNEAADFYVPDSHGETNNRQRLTELSIGLSLDENKLRDLKDKMSFIFGNCSCYFVCASERTIK